MMGFLRRLLGGSGSSDSSKPAKQQAETPGTIAASSVVPATLDPSWPILPERRQVGLTTAERNELSYEATVCPSCGADVAKPPKGRKKCTSCGVYMFVIVVDRSRRRLVTEAEFQQHEAVELAREEEEDAAADREWRSSVRATGVQIAPSDEESVELDVVGESGYQRDLAGLMATLRSGPTGSEVYSVAKLVREPTNRHDRNAVQVLIHGRPVGYLSRYDAEGAQPWLKQIERTGKPAFVVARIGGGRDDGGYLSAIGVTLEELPESVEG
jgi:hypothetical protein